MDGVLGQAEKFFQDFAERRGLSYHFTDHTELDVCMTIPVQPGLSFEITLALQNRDEINIGFCDFWSFIYPFPTVTPKVNALLDGLIDGSCRLRTRSQMGRVLKRDLEMMEGECWEVVYREHCAIGIPLIPTKSFFVKNEV